MAITYSKANKPSIDKAVAKAKQVKPKVKVSGFGQFDVTGSKGDSYRVSFSKEHGEFTAHCGCKANAKAQVCYHVVAVATIFKQQVTERALTRSCSHCGNPLTDIEIEAEVNSCETCVFTSSQLVVAELTAAFAGLPKSLDGDSLAICKVCHAAPASVEGECQGCYEVAIYG